MITVGMDYEVLEGKEEVFEKACDGVIKAIEKSEGHKKTRLYNDVKKPQSYLIVSEWDQIEAFKKFIGSEAFRNVTNWGKEQILAGRPKHEIYETASDAKPRPEVTDM